MLILLNWVRSIPIKWIFDADLSVRFCTWHLCIHYDVTRHHVTVFTVKCKLCRICVYTSVKFSHVLILNFTIISIFIRFGFQYLLYQLCKMEQHDHPRFPSVFKLRQALDPKDHTITVSQVFLSYIYSIYVFDFL